MRKDRAKYIPALSFGWLMPSLRPLPHLVRQARIEPGHRVLDLGCGTATLTILVKQAHPDADVIGLDGDPRVLEIAKSKITRAGLDVALDFMRRLEEASDTIDGMLPGMFVDAGFEHVEESARYRTVFGTLTLYQARKPG